MIKKISLLVAAFVAISTTATSAPIDLDFEFNGVSGTVYGLDNEVSEVQTASHLTYLGRLDTYTVLDFRFNAFEFASGELFAVRLGFYDGMIGDNGTGFLGDIELDFGAYSSTSELNVPGEPYINTGAAGNAVYTQVPISPVPLPAGGLLLVVGAASLIGVRCNQRARA